MAHRLHVRLRSPLALVFALALLGLQSVAPTPPAMAGLVLITGLHLLAYIWVRLAATGLRVTRSSEGTPTFAGDDFQERLTIHSHAWAPLLWGEVRDASALPGYAGSAVIALASRSETTITLSGRALRRGIYAMGPVVLTMGDPFGLFEARLSLGAGSRRVVYPRPQQIPPLAQLRGIVPSEGPAGPDPLDRSPHAVTVRPYVPGDTPRRIHWRTTARRSLPGRDALFVKEFDPQSTGDLWLAMDLDAAAQFGVGDASSEERAVVLAASLVDHVLREGRGVGLMALGATASLLTPRPGPAQRWRLLEELAGMRAEGDTALDEGLRRLSRTVRRGDAVIVITASPDRTWLDGVRALLWRGAQVEALLVVEDGAVRADGDAHQTDEAATTAHDSTVLQLEAALTDLGVPHSIVHSVAGPASRLAA